MEKVFIVTRICQGEDYPEPSIDLDIYSTREKAVERFDEIIQEESDYLDDPDLEVDVEEYKDGSLHLDYEDDDDDYSVVITLQEMEVK